MAVAVPGYGDGVDVAAASGRAYTDGSFGAVGQKIIRDQYIAGGMAAVLRACFDAAITVFDGVSDEIDILCAVRIDSKTGIIDAVAVGNGISVDQPSPGIIDTGGGISVVSGEADGNVPGIIEIVSHDIDVFHIGTDSDGLRPPRFTVFNRVAEEKDIGNGAAAAARGSAARRALRGCAPLRIPRQGTEYPGPAPRDETMG